jgi:hypothetical protein
MPFTEQYARERVRFTAIYPDRARKAAGIAQEPQPVDPPSRSASA